MMEREGMETMGRNKGLARKRQAWGKERERGNGERKDGRIKKKSSKRGMVQTARCRDAFP